MSVLLVFVSTLICILLSYLRYKYSYWERKGIRQLKPHFLLGNVLHLKSMHHSELMHDVYKQYKEKAKLVGAYIFTTPIAIVLDLDLVKTILIKDFNKFIDRQEYKNEENDPLSGHLFLLYGDKWRNLRTKLSPTFTSGKMKNMFPMIVNVAQEFEKAFGHQLSKSADGSIELHDMMGRFTTDVIGTCVFGIECNSLKDPDVEFRKIGKRIIYDDFTSVRWKLFKRTYANVLKNLGFKRFCSDVEEFIMRIVRDTVNTRERLNIKRNDFIDLLIELKNSKDMDGMPGLTIPQLAAQVFVFFVAGFETSSSNMSYGLYELAKNPEVQDKVRNEILKVLEKHEWNLSYEAMGEMKYLDQVVTETLRKYPALGSLTRIVGEDYQISGTNVTLDKGTIVHIPVKEIHYDPDIYKNPDEFRPERFNHDEVQNRHAQAFLGFGDGPRNCIGLRFGRMQIRIGLITLLRQFKFGVCARTPAQMEISEKSFVMVPANGVWLKAEKLEALK